MPVDAAFLLVTGRLGAAFWHWLPYGVKEYYWAAAGVYRNPFFYLLVGAILCVEFCRPAIREQRVFSGGFAQDFMWFNLDVAFKVAALPAYIGLLQLLYNRTTGEFVVPVLSQWPLAVRAVISFVIYDFVQWGDHWIRHKVKPFWHFHAIHHSQREMNLFTNMRIHWGEYLIAHVFSAIPSFLFALTPTAIVVLALLGDWLTRFQHANIRTDLGPFGWIFVSPQFHRVHHSREARHFDRNFGVILSVWDRLFGTWYPSNDEYPPTGVPGVQFEMASGTGERIRGIGRQFAYPFQQLMPRRRAVAADDLALQREDPAL